MYAIFRAKGKQFRAVPDAKLRIPTLDAEPGETVTFDDVLLMERDGDIRVGTPALDGAAVAAEVVGHGRGEKIIVFKMKRRKGYRKKQGHRQGYTEIRIVELEFPGGKTKKPAKKAEPKEPEPEEPVSADEPAAATAEAEAATEAPVEEAEGQEGQDELDITPAALELADEHGLDLTEVEGTGKDGRILKSDVEGAIKQQEDEG